MAKIGEFDECLCSLAELVGRAKSQLTSLLNGLIGLLTALKAQIILCGFSLEDEARKIQYQTELAAIQVGVATVEAPFSWIMGYTRTLSDCDPIATLAATLRNARDTVLSPIKEQQFDIEQMLAALEDKDNELELIERWITMLVEVRDALELCGNQNG